MEHGLDSDSSQSEDEGNGTLDTFDEIVEQSDLDKFSETLKKAQMVALEVERAQGTTRRTYTGCSRTTLYRHNKLRANLASKGFLGLDEFMKQTDSKRRHTVVREESEESSLDSGHISSDPDSDLDLRGPQVARACGCVGGHIGLDSRGPQFARACGCIGGHIGLDSDSDSESRGPQVAQACGCVGGHSSLDSEGNVPSSVAGSRIPAYLLREEEEESGESESGVSPQDKNMTEELNELTVDSDGDGTAEQGPARALLEDLRRGLALGTVDAPQTALDYALDVLCDFSMLRTACEKLAVVSKDKKIDILFRARVASMVGTLNLFLDPELRYTWRNASLISSKAQGHGISHARRIREWILRYLRHEVLPLHCLGQAKWTAFEDEDIAREIKLRLTEKVKGPYMKAGDVVDVIASPEIQAILRQKGICKPSITERTARRWLAGLGWRYGKMQSGMYIDGHEREDVVEYRQQFVVRWKVNERRFHRWDNDGNELPRPTGFPIPGAIGRFRLILVTHDESVFYQNDERKTAWVHKFDKATPRPKGDGQSIMVSDFLTSEWGRLRDGNECVFFVFSLFYHSNCKSLRDARVLFKAGKNRDGWFSSEDLLAQVDRAIDVFEGLTKGYAQGLFLFDNAPSHQKRAPDAISARKMVKGV